MKGISFITMKTANKIKKGFTLIEILVVVALIAILAAVTLIAINPAQTFKKGRDTQRQNDVTQILNAVTQYISDDGQQISDLGAISTDCSSAATMSAVGSGAGNIDLGSKLVTKYIAAIPKDPSGGTPANTGYKICQTTTDSRITVTAPNAETKTISVTR